MALTEPRIIGVERANPKLPPGVIAASATQAGGEFDTADNTTLMTPARVAVRDKGYDMRDSGASPDNADNLAAFDDALSKVPADGGKLILPEPGIYNLSDTWIVRRSDLEIEVMPGVDIHLDGASTYGGTIAIAEGDVYGGSDSDRVERVRMFGGGRVSAEGYLENAVGIVRARDVTIQNIYGWAERYAFTAQEEIERVHFLDDVAEYCGGGFAILATGTGNRSLDCSVRGCKVIESHAATGGLSGRGIEASQFDGLVIADNQVLYAEGQPYRFTGTSATHSKRLTGRNNLSKECGSYALWIDYVDIITGELVQAVGCGGGINIANSADHDISLLVADVASLSSLNYNTLSGRSKIRAEVLNQLSTTGILNVTAAPVGHDWELHVGAGAHNRICANAADLCLHGVVEAGSLEVIGSSVKLLSASTMRVAGGRSRQTLTYAASITPNFWTTRIGAVTLTGNTTITNMSAGTVNPARVPGHRIGFDFTQDGTGGRTVSWGTTWKVGNWTPDTAAGKRNTIEFESDGTDWVQVGGVTGI